MLKAFERFEIVLEPRSASSLALFSLGRGSQGGLDERLLLESLRYVSGFNPIRLGGKGLWMGRFWA